MASVSHFYLAYDTSHYSRCQGTFLGDSVFIKRLLKKTCVRVFCGYDNCMTRKKICKIPRSADARDRYFGMILEDLQGKFSLMLEGYAALNVRIDRLEQRIDEIDSRLEAFRIETNEKFAALFDGQQQFFEEMRQFHLRIEVLEGKS